MPLLSRILRNEWCSLPKLSFRYAKNYDLPHGYYPTKSTCLFLLTSIYPNLLVASIYSLTKKGEPFSCATGCSTLRNDPWGLSN